MFVKLFSIATLLVIGSSINTADGVNCFITLMPIGLDSALTSDNIPLLSNNTAVPTNGHCHLTVFWLKNPTSSIIVLGYDTDLHEDTSLNDTLLVQLRNQLEGEQIDTKTSKRLQYRCRSADRCNDETNLRKIIHALTFSEDFSPQLDSLIASNPSFDRQSIADCYYNRDGTSASCPARDPINCPRCETFSDLIQTSNCATCPTKTSDANTILWTKLYLFDNQTTIENTIQLSCQTGRACNRLDNIQRIQGLASIVFDFEKFYSSAIRVEITSKFFIFSITSFMYFLY